MAPQKRRRRNTPVPESSIGCKLPVDLLLEIVARTDTSTLISCAASCKFLRRDILSLSFIRRVTQRDGIVPPRILAYLYTDEDVDAPRPLSLVHPITPAAVSFSHGHLSPFMSYHTADVLGQYEPVTSRGGLILLRRRNIRLFKHRSDHLCVYDSMTGDRTFFPDPPAISKDQDILTYVLLTAIDGIGCSFKLLAVNVDSYIDDTGCSIKVQTATSSNVGDTSWGPVIYDGGIDLPLGSLQEQRDAIVLHGNVIHWLVWDDEEILTYNIHKQKLGVVKLPPINYQERQRHLGRSPEGRLQLLVTDGFMISVWLQLCSCSWVLEAVIDAEEKLRTLDPYIPPGPVVIEFECSGEMSCVVLLKIWFNELQHGSLIVLDLETKEMRRQAPHPCVLFEVDLTARLLAMKTFS